MGILEPVISHKVYSFQTMDGNLAGIRDFWAEVLNTWRILNDVYFKSLASIYLKLFIFFNFSSTNSTI